MLISHLGPIDCTPVVGTKHLELESYLGFYAMHCSSKRVNEISMVLPYLFRYFAFEARGHSSPSGAT